MLIALKGDIFYMPAMDTVHCLEQGYIVVENGVTRGVFETLPEKYAMAEVTEFPNSVIVPAFCDMHLHAPQYPMLGMGMDLQLLDWLKSYTFKTEARFSDNDYARRVYRALAAELIRKGTTRVCMFSSLHPDATLILMEELEAAGVTGYVGKVNMDRNGGEDLIETAGASVLDTLGWLESCGFPHVRPILTPRFTPSCSDGLMEALGVIAKERGLRVQSHLSENLDEVRLVKELHPDCQQYWETYEKYGLWKENTVMAHCVHSDRRERKAMKEAGVWVAHCPDSNANIRSGIAPVRRMLEEGLNVGLGSDIAGGARLSMMGVLTEAIRASKHRWLQTEKQDDFLRFTEAFYLMTGASRYFGSQPGFPLGEPLHAVVMSDASLAEPARKLTLPERVERLCYLAEEKEIIAVYSEGRRVK